MLTQSLYPLIQVADVENTARFYETHLGFTRIFSSDWYVQLRATADHPFEIALIAYDHESIPAPARVLTTGVILSFYVADAAAEHSRLAAAGVSIVQPLRDEVFGQRHFIAADPDGLLLDIITPIEPDAAWLAANSA
uniref:Glyoxalase/Bleomycin resistance protein/dioxygenase domain protein n=1 Tax=alpha proteobacterium NT18-17 TaxID=1778876 RepID=A0A140D6P6_9PROT|nr:glyoxalase/Bleomycin resistance protein/dioxygenase domain protein [alpha proteobacterium NT18-17]